MDALVEAGVGDADCNLCGESAESLLVVFVEIVDAGVLEVEDSDDLALVDERYGQLGADLWDGFDVAWIFADVGDEDRFAKLGGVADDSDAERDGAVAGDAFAVAGGEAVLELFAALVPEKDGEHLEVDDALEEVADALEEIVQVEDAGYLTRDLVEDGEGLGLSGDAGVEAGVFDSDGHAGGDELEEALVIGGEVGGVFGLNVEDANDFVLDDEGDGEFGADVWVSVDVVGGVVPLDRYVRYQDGFVVESSLADDTLAALDAHALDLGGVSGLEAHPKLVGAVVDE